jgi:hypothetical protein
MDRGRVANYVGQLRENGGEAQACCRLAGQLNEPLAIRCATSGKTIFAAAARIGEGWPSSRVGVLINRLRRGTTTRTE